LDADTHRTLSMAFERHEVGKGYAALTEGPVPARSDHRWSNLLLRGKKRSYESPHGKPAVTEATYLGRHGDWLKWSLNPLTGRNHQLRVHLHQHGWPIVGDALYGATAPWPDGIALRSVRLVLPLQGGPKEITAPAPWA
jgi:tRNA pseudouridine32 synthase/23S rRNA pseudouridine746 synthase